MENKKENDRKGKKVFKIFFNSKEADELHKVYTMEQLAKLLNNAHQRGDTEWEI